MKLDEKILNIKTAISKAQLSSIDRYTFYLDIPKLAKMLTSHKYDVYNIRLGEGIWLILKWVGMKIEGYLKNKMYLPKKKRTRVIQSAIPFRVPFEYIIARRVNKDIITYGSLDGLFWSKLYIYSHKFQSKWRDYIMQKLGDANRITLKMDYDEGDFMVIPTKPNLVLTGDSVITI